MRRLIVLPILVAMLGAASTSDAAQSTDDPGHAAVEAELQVRLRHLRHDWP